MIQRNKARILAIGALRQRAGNLAGKRRTSEAGGLKEKDPRTIRHKLQDHRTDLEMQNEELQRTGKEPEAALSKYFDLFNFAPVGYFTINEAGLIVEANLAGADLLGVKRGFLIKRPFHSFVAGESQPEFKAFCKRVFETGAKQAAELRLLKGRETPVYVHLQGIAAETGKGQGRQCLLAFTDITRQKQAEEEILRLNRELENRIKERTADLEALSYSVSHDLREPLRHIEGFSKAVMEDYAGRLDATGRDYFKRIRDAALRMSHLINAMLRLSRLSSWQLNYSNVDLSSLAASISQELAGSAPERKVKFMITKGVTAKGDSEMLRIVMENLLGNAWKFTERRSSAKIEFGTTKLKGKTVYFVRDDGIGFDMAYADKLFLPFHRLHSRTSFPGVGIGLTTVRRIIEQHGGHIWAESAVEKGATFFFTLPESPLKCKDA